jgi:hypothetical protein
VAIDFWQRTFRGERDPLAGTLRKFGLPRSYYSDKFFDQTGIFEMSETRH